MGLDITAYGYLTPVQGVELEHGCPKDWHRYWMPSASMKWSEEQWPGRAEGIDPDAIYETADRFSFRAGSYSGYGEWRNWLATVAGYASADECWEKGKPGEPFFELINFADNEGTIGPVVAKKLRDDFAAHLADAVAKKPAEQGDWFLLQYSRWWTAFALAACRGAVDFR